MAETSAVQSSTAGGTHEAMLAVAKTAPTQHVPRHVSGREIRARVHGESAMGRFNDRIAVFITKRVGTMWAAYLFVLISLVSFPQAFAAFLNGDTVTGIAWFSQSFAQLVLLPIIMVGQQVISTAQDARAETDHETLTALHRINVQQLQILEMLAKLSRQPGDH
jgi:hypothetical protein